MLRDSALRKRGARLRVDERAFSERGSPRRKNCGPEEERCAGRREAWLVSLYEKRWGREKK